MRSLLALSLLVSTASLAQIATPSRPITDPKSMLSPANPQARPVPLGDLAISRSVGDAVWSKDGKTIFLTTSISGRINVWKVPAEGGWPVQLTESDDAQGGLIPAPDGNTLYFTQDRGGDEFFDVLSVPANGGPVTRLTNTPAIAESNATPSPDGRMIAIDIKPKEAPNVNLALLDPGSGKVRQLTQEKDPKFNWTTVAWMPDGKALITNRGDVLATRNTVWKVDAATGAATELIGSKGPALIAASDVSPDGRFIAYTSNAETGQSRAGIFEIATGKTRWLKPTPWEQYSHRFSPDGKSLLIRTNADGRSTVSRVDVATMAENSVPFPPGFNDFGSGAVSAFSPNSRTMLLYVTGANNPADMWLAPVGGEARPLTRLSMASLTNLPKSQIVTYRSFDGTPVSAIVTIPFNLKRDGSNPAVVIPHGGPTGQAQDYYSRQVTALASRGYFVIQPNFRGSTGYGKAFQAANMKDLGGGDLKDVIAAKDFLVSTGYVDAKKVGITGGSYGGFMTLMALGKTPDAFAAGVQAFGIINWYTMEKTSDALLQQYLYGLLGKPNTDKKIYDTSSPMTYIKQVKAPLLSLQGDNDIRVPRGQAEEVAAVLKAQGTINEVVFYPAEGHGFRKRENQADSLKRTVAWFEKYLKGIAEPDLR